MRILYSANKHGIENTDIEFVYEHSVSSIALSGEHELVMTFGYDTIGRALEVGYITADSGEDIIIHAMKIRQSYRKYLL